MTPSGLFAMLLVTFTLLHSLVSSESSHPKYSLQFYSGTPLENERSLTNGGTDSLQQRIHLLETNLGRSRSVVKQLHGFLASLGFRLKANNGYSIKSKNPCGSNFQQFLDGQNQTHWTRLGRSKCVKLISGLYNFNNAINLCRQNYVQGEDIAHPTVVSADSPEKADDLNRFLDSHGRVTSVWVDQRDASLESNCTELKLNSSMEYYELRSVGCEKLRRVVCEKPVPVPYVELVERQLEMSSLAETLRAETREKVNLRGDRLRTEFNAKFAQLEQTFELKVAALVLEVKKLKEKSALNDETLKELRRPLRTPGIPARVLSLEETSIERQIPVGDNVASINGGRNAVEGDTTSASLLNSVERLLKATGERFKDTQTKEETQNPQLTEQVKHEIKLQVESFLKEFVQQAAKTDFEESKLRNEVEKIDAGSRNSSVALEEVNPALKRTLLELDWKADPTQVNLKRMESAVEALEVWKSTNITAHLAKLVSQLNSSTEESLLRLQTVENQVQSALAFSQWQLGGFKEFQVLKATGVWHLIQKFGSRSPFTGKHPCEEWTFGWTGTTIPLRHRWGRSSHRRESKWDFTLDPVSPHQWTKGWVLTWLKTDYANWGVVLLCENKEIASCFNLHILSRTRTLPPVTLDLLGTVAAERGFPESLFYEQTAC